MIRSALFTLPVVLASQSAMADPVHLTAQELAQVAGGVGTAQQVTMVNTVSSVTHNGETVHSEATSVVIVNGKVVHSETTSGEAVQTVTVHVDGLPADVPADASDVRDLLIDVLPADVFARINDTILAVHAQARDHQIDLQIGP